MSDTVFPPFTVTAAAVEQVVHLGGRVRIDLEPGGCCGTTYVITRDPSDPTDARYGCPGVELFVSESALAVLTGATVDYSGRIKPRRFRVLRNPNTPRRCRCNRSFGRDWPGKGQPECRAKCPMPWADQ
ncbi:iron-sulfur cluster assembly accessory protein [Arthrobacter tecti]